MSSVTPTQDRKRTNSLVSRLHLGEQNMENAVQEVIVDNMRTTLEDAPAFLIVAESLASEGTKGMRQEVISAGCDQVILLQSQWSVHPQHSGWIFPHLGGSASLHVRNLEKVARSPQSSTEKTRHLLL